MRALGVLRVVGLILIISFAIGCSDNSGIWLDTAIGHYNQNDLDKALEFFEKASKLNSDNPRIYSWLAETYRRQGMKEESLKAAEKALSLDPNDSFAHTVLGDLYNPMYGVWGKEDRNLTWDHLKKAVECNPDDGNAWLAIWTETIYRGDHEMEMKSLNGMMESGIFTPAVIAYNKWMLQHLPPDAILLTNGDMDTYPAVALQEVEKYRDDVAVVNYSLLNTPWYAKYIRDKYKVKLPFSDMEIENLKAERDKDGNITTAANKIMRAWLKAIENGEIENPMAIAVTVNDLSFAEYSENNICFKGSYRLWTPEPEKCDQASSLNISFDSINPNDFTGSFVSENDRSAIRQSTSNRIITNITAAALRSCYILIESDRTDEAKERLVWIEEFENNSALGPFFTDQIVELQAVLALK